MRQHLPKITTDRARALRREATPAERALWRLLATYRPRLTTQLSVHPYIIDLACRQAKLGVELDGARHADLTDYHTERTAYLERRGWRIIRLWNAAVLTNPTGAVDFVLAAVAKCLPGVAPGARLPRPPRNRSA